MLLNRKDLNTLEKLTDFITWLSCHDFRKEKPNISRVAVYKNISRLERIFVSDHIKDIRVFDILTATGVITDKGIIRRIIEYIESGEAANGLRFLPHYKFISSVSITMSGKAIVSYYVPVDLIEYLVGGLEGYYKKIRVGQTIPVWNCCRYGDIECNRKYYYEATRPPEVKSSHVLDFIILSVLDDNPFTRLKEITYLAKVLQGRFDDMVREQYGENYGFLRGRIRYRFILKRYNILSANRIAGRIRIPIPRYIPHSTLSIIAPRECGENVYGVLASYLATPRILATEEEIIAGGIIPADAYRIVSKELADCNNVQLDIPVDGWIYALPFEYYNPFEDKWVPEPVDVAYVLKKLGLLERRFI